VKSMRRKEGRVLGLGLDAFRSGAVGREIAMLTKVGRVFEWNGSWRRETHGALQVVYYFQCDSKRPTTGVLLFPARCRGDKSKVTAGTGHGERDLHMASHAPTTPSCGEQSQDRSNEIAMFPISTFGDTAGSRLAWGCKGNFSCLLLN